MLPIHFGFWKFCECVNLLPFEKKETENEKIQFLISVFRFIAQCRLPPTFAMRLIDEIRPFANDLGDVPLAMLL